MMIMQNELMMKRLIILFVMGILLCLGAHAQPNNEVKDYNTGLGLRLGGYTSGFTVKGFINSKGALEGIAGFGIRSFVVTGLYEHHFPITGVTGLNLYTGGGAHIGFFGHRSAYLFHRNKKNGNVVYLVEDGATAVIPGIDFIFGIEYKFQGAPFTIGADLKPFADFYDGVSGYADGALNLRYVF